MIHPGPVFLRYHFAGGKVANARECRVFFLPPETKLVNSGGLIRERQSSPVYGSLNFSSNFLPLSLFLKGNVL